MSAKVAKNALRLEIRDRLSSIEVQAARAQRVAVSSDNLCDILDDLDNELQTVIRLVNGARAGEGGAS